METERLRYRATREAERFAEEKLGDQQYRYEAGRATSHDVFQFQEDLTRARVAVVGARIRYLEALVDLHRSMGTLAAYRGISADQQTAD